MNRRQFAIASAFAAMSLLMSRGIDGGHDAVARKRRRQGGDSAVARAAVTGTGGSVSVAVSCGSGRASSNTDNSQAVARC